MNNNKLGKLIKKLRLDNNMSQAQLANKLSVTSQAISKWENGRGIPDIEFLKLLSEIFNINIDDLLKGKENIKEEQKTDLRKQKILIFTPIIVLIIILIALIIVNQHTDTFNFNRIGTSDNSFNVTGVIAYNKDKKSIYVSNVTYKGDNNKIKYKHIEGILYETDKNKEVVITKWNSKDKTDTLQNLLEDFEFNVDNYTCSCNKACNKLYIRLIATKEDNVKVVFNVPLKIDNKCQTK